MKKLVVVIVLSLCFIIGNHHAVLASQNQDKNTVNPLIQLGNSLQEYTRNTPLLGNSLHQLDVKKLMSAPFDLFGIFFYGIAAVVIYRTLVTGVIKWVFTRDEIRRNRRISRNLKRVFADIGR